MKPTLVFDYDGTINNTIVTYEPAFRAAVAWLKEQGVNPPEADTSRIRSYIGLNAPDMWADYMPDLDPELMEHAKKMIGDENSRRIQNGEEVWFEGMEEMLNRLKAEGYPMVVLSNCRKITRDTHWEVKHLERWFAEFYDCARFDFIPKTEIIKLLKADGTLPEHTIVIGDRIKDKECADAVGCPFIGCLYGFGSREELAGAARFAEKVEDVILMIKELE